MFTVFDIRSHAPIIAYLVLKGLCMVHNMIF